MSADHIPSSLATARHWVLRKGKKPVGLTGRPEKGWQLPGFWLSYDEANEVWKNNVQDFDGLGFIIARDLDLGVKQIIGIDLDCCRDPETGWVSPWARDKLDQLFSYTEVTPSGTGFHCWILGKLPEGMNSAESDGTDPESIPPETWARVKALKPTATRANSVEIYEDGPRHFTWTGHRLGEYPGQVRDRQAELDQILLECNKSQTKAPDCELIDQMVKDSKTSSLPELRVTDVINCKGFSLEGDQLFGLHPVFGSSTGKNLVVNPSKNVWAYMHNGLNKGGDAWTWLACVCGAVKWEEAGRGSLSDPQVMQKVKDFAVSIGLFKAEDLPGSVLDLRLGLGTKEPLTEGGNATRLCKLHGANMCYNHTFRQWLIWDGRRWQPDTNGEAMRRARDVVAQLYLEAAEDNRTRMQLGAFAMRADCNIHMKNVLDIAKTKKEISITSKDLDHDPWLLSTQTDTLDLKNMVVREAKREDLITKSAGTKYDPGAECPLWITFLDKIFKQDEELISYVQRAVGYSLTGLMDEQMFFFCHGNGANGKSVFPGVLRTLMGEYAAQADFSTFLVQRSERVRNDLAALAGARLILASEAEEGSKLSMQVIKAWTGGDHVTARRLFAEYFTFKPTGKIWLAANTKPAISDRNYAAWRRVHLIPFLVTIPKKEQDKKLESKLLTELPGILNWALGGLRKYHQVGLEPPEAVKTATENYRKENDSIEAFISEMCEVRKLAICKNKELYSAYISFCEETGFHVLSQRKFSSDLMSRNEIYSMSSRDGIVWHGIDVKSELKCDRLGPILDNRYRQTSSVTDVTQNAESFAICSRVENFAEKPSHPSHSSPNRLDGTGLSCNQSEDTGCVMSAPPWSHNVTSCSGMGMLEEDHIDLGGLKRLNCAL